MTLGDEQEQLWGTPSRTPWGTPSTASTELAKGLGCCLTHDKERGKSELMTSLEVFLEHVEPYLGVVALSYGCVGNGSDQGPLGQEVPTNCFYQ